MVYKINHLLQYITLSVRAKQWTKNLLVFLALFFSLNEGWEIAKVEELFLLLTKTTLSFFIFCFLSSSMYLINDILDKDKDALHPEKSKRPIASGKISVKTALVVSFFIGIISVISAFFLNKNFGIISITDLSIMSFYSLYWFLTSLEI